MRFMQSSKVNAEIKTIIWSIISEPVKLELNDDSRVNYGYSGRSKIVYQFVLSFTGTK